MKKFFPVYVRVPLILFLFFGAIELLIDSGDKPAIIEYPSLLILLGLVALVLIAIEIVAKASDSILNQLMSPEERAEKERLENLPVSEMPAYKNLMKKLTRTRAMSEEKEIELAHDYDGIKELDNDLPPWWVYLFYATVIFSVVYLAKYHLFGGDNQYQELEKTLLIAEKEIEEYKKNAPDLLTADQVVASTDPADLVAGKAIFDSSCVACHRADGGGGIGPNLTDEYWILGGEIKDIFHVISEGGRDGRGMVAWKQQIKPGDIAKVASYILSLQGTNPADAKEPEGDKVVQTTNGETAPETETESLSEEVLNDETAS